MRYHVLATDYDGTLAHFGRVDEPTLRALERLKDSGRRLILVSGRELEDLETVFDRLDLFDLAVLENGALIYRPSDRREWTIGEPPPREFVERLRERGAPRVSAGRVVVALWEPHHTTAFDLIHEMGLEHHIVFNKGAVMVLPSGVNKAVGLERALAELGLSRHNTVAVGDAENDHALLAHCEFGAAVSNAIDSLKERADLVTDSDHGAGVAELIDRMLEDDLRSLEGGLGRHAIAIGRREDGEVERLEPYGRNVLVAGTSGSGKSTLVTGLLERLADPGYQFVVIDPEGDFTAQEHAAVLGDPHRAPLMEEVIDLLREPGQNVVVNLLGIALEHRPAFFAELLPRLQELRGRTGRPQWIVVDEAHHLLPDERDLAALPLPRDLQGLLLITVHPGSVTAEVLHRVDLVLAVGSRPERTLAEFGQAVGEEAPAVEPGRLETGQAILWRRGQAAQKVRTEPPHSERIRHSRKYAEGNIGLDRSFYFRGPDGRLNLRCQNLCIFLQIGDGVDDDTWTFHLRNGDIACWFRQEIKDDELAATAEEVADQQELDPKASRLAIRRAVEARYSLPTDAPSGEIDE